MQAPVSPDQESRNPKNSPLIERLQRDRQSLLDLSLRNRLLNVPQQTKSKRLIQIEDERSDEVYRLLVKEGKALTFLPRPEIAKKDSVPRLLDTQDDQAGEQNQLAQPIDEDELDERGIAKRHSDHRLQTQLASEELQKRLLNMYYDAKTFEEEQGVNVLYLALGALRWYEADSSELERFAPLLLVPVELERGSATQKFRLKWRGEDISASLSLQAKMRTEFGIILPDLPEGDELDVLGYMQQVTETVNGQKRFEIRENVVTLGFFSFAKFLMYRDLDVANWPGESAIERNSLISGLLRDGFPSGEPLIDEEEFVDDHITPQNMRHVLDADSSQTLAIEEARRGRNLVIQGPPGTGKSQTITNMIAAAVAEGKTVLFVAEKMAALEVVYRRLEQVGLGSLCLELHSHKANKRTMLDELRKTKELNRPRGHDQGRAAENVYKLRQSLNQHAASLHDSHYPSGYNTYQIMGHSLSLQKFGSLALGVSLVNPEQWDPDQFEERRGLLGDIATRLKKEGAISEHPWRGVMRSALLPNEYEQLMLDLTTAIALYESIITEIASIEEVFALQESLMSSFDKGYEMAKALTAMPDIDTSTLTHRIWEERREEIVELVSSCKRYAEQKRNLDPQVNDAAWTADLAQCRHDFAVHGRSAFRFLSPAYRRAKALLSSLLTVPIPKAPAACLALVDSLMQAQRLEKVLREGNQLGQEAFGRLWRGSSSDVQKLSAYTAWRDSVKSNTVLPHDFLARCASITRSESYIVTVQKLTKLLPQFYQVCSRLFQNVALDFNTAFGSSNINWVERKILIERLTLWQTNGERISAWISLQSRMNEAREKGLTSLIERIELGTLDADNLSFVFERAYFDALVKVVFTKQTTLRDFDGDRHSQIVEQFREFDRQRIEQARIEVKNIHYAKLPKVDGGSGPLGVLNAELAKKRNHMPIRQLLKRAGVVVQALKPVFMMSPLSIAQFLEPGALKFDLLFIDEASQVEPVDALGAIARTRQIVVVGDSKQLPPTRFFSKLTSDDTERDTERDEEEEVSVATQDVESILSLCIARGLPERMLRWHYRSKHQSLIAVSNKEFYDSKLFIVPSPHDNVSGMGLRFHHLPHATFDRGGTTTNVVEAKAVADAVMRHVREYPQMSLGVGTFSIKQRLAILDEIELLRRKYPECEPFFTQEHLDEPFFVKNLENIQGDERDVIFISVGYGRNPQGYMAMSFGPLSSEGGERRLNVLISRAKRRCEVFSSITADDIDLERARGRGVAALKLFLTFAQTGRLDIGHITDRKADSIFEEQVASALRDKGYDVKTQIGIAGFFIDIAVTDPQKPGRFILGIECDGAGYHSSRSARDRDRLRQSVLEANGWIIHRIWSTDWFRRPQEQLQKTIEKIESAKRALEEESPITLASPSQLEIVTFETESETEEMVKVLEKSAAIPYLEAAFAVPLYIEPHEVADAQMVEYVVKVVIAEGPIHSEEVIARIRSLWHKDRAGSRIQAKVERALMIAVNRGRVEEEDEFYTIPNAQIQIRNRGEVTSLSLRKPEHIPPAEIGLAIKTIITANYGADQSTLPNDVARLFGFKATSAQLRYRIERVISDMKTNGNLKLTGDILELVET